MRSAAIAALIYSGIPLLVTTSANAHGPGDHVGGHISSAAAPGGAGGSNPGKVERAPASHDHLNAHHITNTGGKSDKPDFAGLHPNSTHDQNIAAGNSGLRTNGLNQAAINHSTNGFMPLNNNLASQGGLPAFAHHAGELLSFLEMAQNSTDPQVAARATQLLQQFRHLAQQNAGLSQGQSNGALGTNTNSVPTNGFMPVPSTQGSAGHSTGHPTH